MNKILLLLIVAVLCVVITSAGVLTAKKRNKESAVAKTDVTASSSPVHNATQISQSPNAAANPENAATPSVPEPVVYWHLFHHNNLLLKKAEENERLGKDAKFLRDFYKNEAKLNDNQATIFREIAASVELEVSALDAEAKLLIQNFRANHPGGLMKSGEKLPPPPPQLEALQKRRNNTILHGRDRLHQAFGQQASAEFQKFVHEKVAPKIKRESFDKLRPALPEGQQRQSRNNPYKGK
jgi:hypothetical protein